MQDIKDVEGNGDFQNGVENPHAIKYIISFFLLLVIIPCVLMGISRMRFNDDNDVIGSLYGKEIYYNDIHFLTYDVERYRKPIWLSKEKHYERTNKKVAPVLSTYIRSLILINEAEKIGIHIDKNKFYRESGICTEEMLKTDCETLNKGKCNNTWDDPEEWYKAHPTLFHFYVEYVTEKVEEQLDQQLDSTNDNYKEESDRLWMSFMNRAYRKAKVKTYIE
ncbi:MAG: hypothetical protein ABIH66_13650 [bacterium]